MKPQTIVTLEGIFTLNRDGFYVPVADPERSYPWAWVLPYAWGAVIGIVIAAGCLWAVFAA